MMMNIFNIFDPSTSMKLSLNWLSMLIFMLLMPYMYWLSPSRFMMLWHKLNMYLYEQFKTLISYSYSNLIIFLSLFIFLFFNNFMGLFSYIFTSSGHMSFCFPISLSMFMGIMIYSVYNYFNDLCSHLTPQGTPFMLMPFMVMIESISLIIRPLTLAIRLTANMIAGHLLLTLIGSAQEKMFLIYLPLLIMTQTLLMFLEIFVSMIQAYVFSVLMLLYSSET